MRTTINLDGGLMAAAKAAAERTGRTVGEVISEWALRGIRENRTTIRRGAVPTFEVPANEGPITPDTVRRLIEDEGVPTGR